MIELRGAETTSAELDGFLGLVMKLEIDMHNGIDDLEDVFMIDPEDKNSYMKLKNRLNSINDQDLVYPAKVMNPLIERIRPDKRNKHPQCLFMPSKRVLRIFVN